MGAVAARLSDLVVVDLRQPAIREPGGHHRADQARHRRRPTIAAADGSAPRPRRRAASPSSIARRRSSGRSARRMPGDLILIAGKGHEKYQVIGERVLPFDDVEVARTALERRRAGSTGVLTGGWLPLSATDVANATGGRLVQGDAATAIGRVRSIRARSRPATSSSPSPGRRFDGHQFVQRRRPRGAIGAMVHQAPASPEAGTGDAAAASSRSRTRPARCRISRVTCAAGRARPSSRSPAARARPRPRRSWRSFCRRVSTCFRNQGNLNNHIGLPLSLLQLRGRPQIAVVELGMNHPGEISTLVGIAEPDVRVWTNVGDAHLGFFESAEAIADAKAEILENAAPSHLLVANADDPRIMEHARRFAGTVDDLRHRCRRRRARDVGRPLAASKGMEARGRRPADARRGCARRCSGSAISSNVLAGIAVGLHFGVPLDAMVARAGTLIAGVSSRRNPAAARRRHADRRLLQLESGGARPGARDDGDGDGQRPEGRRARRDARAGRVRRIAAPRGRTARGGTPGSIC